jgi:predicted DCC family thiol-disulfide oxidoreductase YuxK
LLWDRGRWYRRSDAALRAIVGLGGPWGLARPLFLVPRILRDTVYDFIARNRYRWFGKREACRMPSPAERDRFLP